MKKIILSALCIFAAVAINAQEQERVPSQIPMAVSISESSSSIPSGSEDYLVTRMKAAIANNGMGATENCTQFYMTCTYTLLANNVIPGAPTKFSQTAEMQFFVIDAFAKKVFTQTSLNVKGIGNSEQQASMQSIKQFTATNKTVAAFIKDSNKKILDYYNAQYKTMITKAQSLAKVYQYEEALFILSQIPEACIGYQEAIEAACVIFQKYLDDKAQKNLAKARAIWNAGQDAAAAAEAGTYLAEILPDATCYPQAVALSNEIKARIKSDIDYYRMRDERTEDYSHAESMATIEAWKAVGVAYGNNQKSMYYKSIW